MGDEGPKPIDALADTVATDRTRARIDPALARTEVSAGPSKLPRISLGTPSAASEDERDLELVEELGRGGMGVVFRARQHSIGRDVAVKRVIEGAEDAGVALLYEARITGSLEHPNIVPVHMVGRDALGEPVIVMKRIGGTTWSALLRDAEHPRWGEIEGDRLRFNLQTLIHVCNAVAFAHAQGVVHRDIKPENVMIGEFGEVYLLDWGIAVRVDRQGEPGLAGTPVYMAPEMVAMAPVSERSDVYLLGASLHEVLTGRPRHTGSTLAEVLENATASRPAPLPDVPEELATICNRATHREPSERYASARELRVALEQYLVHRASNELAARATLSLEKLIELGEGAPVEQQRLLASECRFGFRSALEQWPDNAAAQRGLRKTLVRMFEAELSRGNLDAADGFLADLEDGAEHRARLAAARAERDENLARLRRDVRQLDATVSAGTRAAFGAVLGVLLFGSALALGHFVRSGAVTMSLGVGVAFNTVALAVVTVARPLLLRRIERTRYNVAMLDVLQVFVAGTVLLRAAGWYAGVPIASMLAFEGVATVMVYAVLGATLDRAIYPAAVLATPCAIATLIWPRFAFELILLCEMGAFGWVVALWYRHARAER